MSRTSRIRRLLVLLTALGALTFAAVAAAQVSGASTAGDDDVRGTGQGETIDGLAGDDEARGDANDTFVSCERVRKDDRGRRGR
jgi:hypothetical protein